MTSEPSIFSSKTRERGVAFGKEKIGTLCHICTFGQNLLCAKKSGLKKSGEKIQIVEKKVRLKNKKKSHEKVEKKILLLLLLV